jgi:two-component system, NarL family, invasion response regulator UvrY
MNKITVLLVDDHAIVRAGFRMLLAATDSIEIIAEAERGETACQLYLDKKPDVVVLDLSMPGIGGLECIRRICVRDPKAKILVFSVHDESVYVSRAIDAGASGYITKSSAPEILVDAIQTIATGGIYVESGLAKNHSNKIGSQRLAEIDYKTIVDTLSSKEFDIFCLLAKGLTNHSISDELCLSYKTVANYGTQIKTKFNASTVTELAHIATALGIIKKAE